MLNVYNYRDDICACRFLVLLAADAVDHGQTGANRHRQSTPLATPRSSLTHNEIQ